MSGAAAESWRRALTGVLLLAAGTAIAWVDTRPSWDDAGVTAGAVAVAAVLGGLSRMSPWLVSALVSAPLLVSELPNGAGVILAVPFALVGAFSGALLRREVAAHR